MLDGLIKLMNTSDEIIGPINLGNPSEFKVIELAELIIDLTNSKSEIIHLPLPEDDPIRRQPDISKAKSILEWQPKISLKEGLVKTIEYFERLMIEGDL
jgi:UDP-glucuronate decarboxylase